jgi:hypothetical protein
LQGFQTGTDAGGFVQHRQDDRKTHAGLGDGPERSVSFAA